MEEKIIRRLDDLGRIVIVKAIRKQLGLKIGDAMMVEVNENGQVILTKVEIKE